MNRNLVAAVAATTAVIVVVILGFHALGGPGTQRLVQSDLRVVRLLYNLATRINLKWTASGRVLPADLAALPESSTKDAVTGQKFSYRRKSDSQYELCASFSADSHNPPGPEANGESNFWSHPKGDYCFQFDASQPVPQSPYYY
jgi:hypothetical protein